MTLFQSPLANIEASSDAMPPKTKTLLEREQEAAEKDQPPAVGRVAYALRDQHIDPYGYDQWYLTIVLATVLGYMFTRSAILLLIVFVVWFFFENLMWLLVASVSDGVRDHLRAAESRSREIILDPIVFALALALAVFAFEYTVVGDAVPLPPPLGHHGDYNWLQAGAVVLIACLSGFVDLYWISAWLLLITIWLFYALYPSHLQLRLAVAASLASFNFFAWFLRPIGRYFLYNALFSMLYAALFISIADIASKT